MSKPKKSKAAKTVNAREIKAWLRGIQEFQPEGWTPSAEQWATIREKIFLLEEPDTSDSGHNYVEEVRYAPTPYAVAVNHTPAYAAVPVQSHLSEAAPSSGTLAVARSPTETGVVSASSNGTVLEGEYKSQFS